MSKPVCAVVGVGPGNGVSFARALAVEGYAVAMMARNNDKLSALAAQVDGALPVVCDVTDEQSVKAAFTKVKRELGPVDVLLYNAGSGHFGSVEEVNADDMEQNWRVNTLGLLLTTHAALADMKEKAAGKIVVTGATASLRGGAKFAAFASAKAAQRSLAQSMARHLGPQGIHVSLVIVDGVIDMERTRAFFSDKPDDFFLKPDHIAQSVVHLVKQQRSAWTFELDVRPYGESW